MRAKKATAKPEPGRTLTKAEACKLLQVAPTADEELITQAYWYQARKVRAYARHDPEARRRLDELNRAYRVLNPASTEAPLERETPPPDRTSVADAVSSSFKAIVDEVASRWPGHATEVAVLSVTTMLLAFLALEAGASPLWTLVSAGVAAIAIWAPWRNNNA